MKNKEDVFALKAKAHEVYEKLSVLAYVEEYINNTPNPEHTKEELLSAIENANQPVVEVEEKEETFDDVLDNTIEKVLEKEEPKEEVVKHDLLGKIEEETEVVEEIVEEEVEEIKEVVLEVKEEETTVVEDVVEEDVVEEVKEDVDKAIDFLNDNLFSKDEEDKEEVEEKKMPSLDDELKDTIAVDVVADLFENAPKKSLNDKLQGDIQIGWNDRIAFVKNLFGGSQEDFNRVVSQLNTFKTEKEAKKFINKMVKPDYDWTDNEEFEERFMNIVERKFV
jgi:hypothetical protein